MEAQFDTRHLITPQSGRLTELLPALLSLSTERVSELLDLGSVYVNKKRVLLDTEVPSQTYVRVHCKPKRYPVEKTNWKSSLVFENEHFIVINKPAGFPVPSAVDNVRETVIAQLQKALGYPLFITQRLDVPTQGLTLFAKTSDFQKSFNGMLAQHQVYKEYLARTENAPAIGLHTHFMKPAMGAPREVFFQGETGWKECRLNVLSVKEERVAKGTSLFSTSIHLLTGRTHQIRAQMKAVSCTLWGDQAYGSIGSQDEFFLQSRILRFVCPLSGKNMEFHA